MLGPEVAAFEREFAAYVGAAHGIGVNSGTSALHLALLAAGVGPGDEVITTPFTFVATVAAIRYAGARPVFVDIDPGTFNIDAARIEKAITSRTKAILPVHLYGQPADLTSILEIGARRKLLVIEDAAQAHGAEHRGRRVGGLGDLGCFSFYPSKNLGAYGEGGMVVTRSPELGRVVRMLRDFGQEKKYHHALKGFNYRMEGIQGAILRVKLRHLEGWTEARRRLAAKYDLLLAGSRVATPPACPGDRHVYHVYAVRAENRDLLAARLLREEIHTGIHYPIPVHLQEAHADLGYREGSFPEAERAAREVLSLPMFPELQEADVETVAAAIRRATA